MGYFVIKKQTNGQYMFNLFADNHEVILTSEGYVAKAGAINGIQSVKVNSPYDNRYQRKTAANGKPYFVLTATNGEIICTSELYSSTQAMERGIASVKANAPNAPTKDTTI